MKGQTKLTAGVRVTQNSSYECESNVLLELTTITYELLFAHRIHKRTRMHPNQILSVAIKILQGVQGI